MVRDTVAPRVAPDVAHTAELLVSELVTNAVTHGRGVVRLAIECIDQSLSVTVSDDDPTAPQVMQAELMALGGRGLRMIDALASSWGVTPHRDGTGKDVWFRLP
jgi:anti-sigma regulatory factor (Ser/Thr protein kinase)